MNNLNRDTKICSSCKEEKLTSEFHSNQTTCKKCKKIYHLEHYEEITTQVRANRLRINFGLTIEQYDRMLEIQDRCCAICGKTPEENNKRLAVDHNHTTGIIRSLLCHNCNVAIGLLQDNPKLCRIAAKYLEEYSEEENE